MRKSHGLILQAINGNIHYKIFFYYWSSFFLALCICSPTRGSMQTMNKNYKDGVQLKIFDLQAPKQQKRKKKKKRSSGSTSQKKELISWGPDSKALACLLMMNGKLISWAIFRAKPKKKKKKPDLLSIYLDLTFLYSMV